MKSLLIAFGTAASLLFFAAPVSAQTASGKCAALTADYDQIEKAMASRWSSSLGDNSAPRATMREMEDSNGLAQAQIILTLMQANRCTLPDHAPSIKRYLSAALACGTARLKGGAEVPECKMEAWQPSVSTR
ncbi:MAG TPA: hypothetical protein VFQ67_11760 [Allosphingosinicella sp.]|jgi:hypothetical protein|nr:hypothetical protein [Allosphingosinicella sp.]